MEINEITALIMSLAPTISAIIGVIVSLIVGLNRIKHDNRDTLDECRKQNAAVIENVAQVVKENDKLKAENEELRELVKRTLDRLNHVKTKDK